MSDGGQKLTLLGHLQELRRRIIRSVIAIAIAAIISLVYWRWILYILILPAQGIHLIFIEVTEMVGVTMKISIAGALVLSMPYLIFQGIMFVSPALTRKEKRYLYIILPWILLMFAAGVVFCYFVLIPPAMNFLINFGSDIATPQIKIGNYISIVTRLLLTVGLIFEMPVVTTFLARIGIIKSRWLAGKRRAAIIIAFVVAAIITPTFDPINQSLVALPLIVLYEISIWLAKLVERKKTATPVLTAPAQQ